VKSDPDEVTEIMEGGREDGDGDRCKLPSRASRDIDKGGKDGAGDGGRFTSRTLSFESARETLDRLPLDNIRFTNVFDLAMAFRLADFGDNPKEFDVELGLSSEGGIKPSSFI